MKFADLKTFPMIQHQPQDIEKPVNLPNVVRHEVGSPFSCSKERVGFPMVLWDFLASFISSFAQQDLLIFLRHRPKLLWQQSCLLIKGEWVSCHEKLLFPSNLLCRFPGVWELVYENTGNLIEKFLLCLIHEILNKLCICYDFSTVNVSQLARRRGVEKGRKFTHLNLHWDLLRISKLIHQINLFQSTSVWEFLSWKLLKSYCALSLGKH